ncbi:MAG: aspartate aminotransferase family protein [Clostridia bacterium]
MDTKQLKIDDKNYVANTYGRFDLALVSGSGCTLTDSEGKTYLDFTSGIGVNSIGYCDESWVSAVSTQANTLAHTSNLYYTEPCVKLAKTLCERTNMKKVFFANSGAEANEGAIKTVRKYSFDKYGEGRTKILTLVNSFHGRTMATLTATGQDTFHNYFFPFLPDFDYAIANDMASIKEKCDDKVCAIMIEMVQGEGGVIPLDKDFVKELAEFCAEKDILLVVDEVQTGMGRTGSLLAYMQFDITPDVVTMAKGLGGGLPIGAVMFGEKTENTMSAGMHGSTFGANPIVCAGANAVLEKLTDEFIENVKTKSEKLVSELLKLEKVKSVDGLGLMLGIELTDGIEAKDVVAKAMQKGLLVLTAKHKVRLLPPLIVSDEQISEAIKILSEILA